MLDCADHNNFQGDEIETDQRKRKLFVGMAPKSAYEEDYRAVFAPFGTPIDIYVIRDRNGFSKGCAFVKYESVKSASDAIEALHDKYIMPGGFRTLVVTVADDRRGPNTNNTRDAAGAGDFPHSLARSPSFGDEACGGNSVSFHGALTPGRPVAAPQAACPVTSPTAPSPVVPGMPYLFCGGNPPQGTYVYYPYVPSSSSGQLSPGSMGLSSKPHHAFTVGAAAGATSRSDARAGGSATSTGSPRQSHLFAHGVQDDDYGGDSPARDLGNIGPEERGRRWAKQPVGPPGANLFVYYLPGSLLDADLATAFSPFGEVVSAKVYYDRDTGESKGFGEQGRVLRLQVQRFRTRSIACRRDCIVLSLEPRTCPHVIRVFSR